MNDEVRDLAQQFMDSVYAQLGKKVSVFIALHDTDTDSDDYIGRGCPACSVLRIVEWANEKELQHDTAEMEPPAILH